MCTSSDMPIKQSAKPVVGNPQYACQKWHVATLFVACGQSLET